MKPDICQAKLKSQKSKMQQHERAGMKTNSKNHNKYTQFKSKLEWSPTCKKERAGEKGETTFQFLLSFTLLTLLLAST